MALNSLPDLLKTEKVMQMNTAVTRSSQAILQTNKLIKNTYMLLSMTLIFSGFTAFLSVAMNESPGIAFAATLVGIFLIPALYAAFQSSREKVYARRKRRREQAKTS